MVKTSFQRIQKEQSVLLITLTPKQNEVIINQLVKEKIDNFQLNRKINSKNKLKKILIVRLKLNGQWINFRNALEVKVLQGKNIQDMDPFKSSINS